MDARERVLVHQVHPVKLTADIAAAVASTLLLWHGRYRTGWTVRFAVPILASAGVLAWADIESRADTRAGRYVLAHMPPSAQALRLAGDAVLAWGACRRRRSALALGVAVITVGWAHGLLPNPKRMSRP